MLEPPEAPRPPEVRVSDADRDRVVDLLRRHCADGRITLDEFSDRVGLAYAARTANDLVAVTADLPAEAPVTTVGEASRRKPVSSVLGIMSGGKQRGRWRPAPELSVVAVMGGCYIDLRQAEIDGPEVVIHAIAVMGGIDVVVPEGIEVELTGVSIMGGRHLDIRPVPRLPGTPIVRVKAVAIMGGVHVRTKRERTRSQPSVDRGQERMDRALEQANRHVERATRRAEQAIRQMEQRDARRYGHGHGGQRGERAAARAARLGASIVEAVLADPQPQTFDGTVTILFSDIEGFTDITERLGDLKAQDVLRAHNEVIRGQLAAHGGHEVKSLGDSFMLSFDGARRALRCAIGVQRALEEYNDKHPEASIRVRIGLHTGEAIREGDDLFGKTVIVASRVAAEADGGEILVSSLLKELADSSGEFEFGPPREAVLKGLSATHTLYPVVWEGTGGG